MIAELTESEEGQSLLAMLIDDFYQQSLHAPLIAPDKSPSPRRGERAVNRSSRYANPNERRRSRGQSRRPRKRRSETNRSELR